MQLTRPEEALQQVWHHLPWARKRREEKRTARLTGRALDGHVEFSHCLRRRSLCYNQPQALGTSRERHNRFRRIKLREIEDTSTSESKQRRKGEEGRSGSRDTRKIRPTCHNTNMASEFIGVRSKPAVYVFDRTNIPSIRPHVPNVSTPE